jgi:hypothetical protein
LKRENPKNENTEQAKIQISKTETQGGEKTSSGTGACYALK